MSILYIILTYIILINIIAFAMYGVDKRRAIKNKWRVSESALIMVCVLGGSVGGIIGIKLFHHKTRHRKFTIGVPLILIMQMLAVLILSGTFFINLYIENYSGEYIGVPDKTVDAIIVPGAKVYGDSVSVVLAKRLDEGVRLYKGGLAKKIIVTGDHGTIAYDEVNAMRDYLTRRGVAKEDVFMDHAGFDTYSSMYRAKEVFKVKSTVVTSQNYHNVRAIYIGRKLGIEVYASDAEDVYIGRLAPYREYAARVKAFFEVMIKKEPKYLGEPIPVSGSGLATEG